MLLVHQAGSVKIGEVIRYTLTYTPSTDRVLPSPGHLYIKIKNTSAIPLRAAYLHGPYTLHVSAYPSTFNPNKKFESSRRDGVPEFEPLLKAGGHWTARLTVPEDIRESGDKVNSKRNLDGSPKTVTWIIEIASQILFSNSASVHYELLVGRDERSLEIGFAAVAGKGHGEPGSIKDFKNRPQKEADRHPTMPKGVYSKAVELVVEDTAALWVKPGLPQWKDQGSDASTDMNTAEGSGPERKQKPKKLHLVILTHGLHSNVGADMLYMKESIDNAAKQARQDARERRARTRRRGRGGRAKATTSVTEEQKDQSNGPAPVEGGQDQLDDDEDDEDEDDEQIVVRGFAGNSVRTERGIQYLGKRLAKYVLTTTYPDQPFLPTSKSMKRSMTGSFSNTPRQTSIYGEPTFAGSGILRPTPHGDKLPYTFTSISFIGHSLGGLVQIYAIAYIHKHAPDFFTQIKPVNFITMASPLLGLSNENPLYVKFALDFGLVGRTGQDLGLTWRAPTIARSGWSAMISGFGSGGKPDQQSKEDPRSKPLLRILPTGPAHQVLKMFRNRTVYSNVVNDGIVPLRTSCLLFLDWRGLDRVENARRENGLIGTMAAFGWAELTGANTSSHRPPFTAEPDDDDSLDDGTLSKGSSGKSTNVPQPRPNETSEDNQDAGQDGRPRGRSSLDDEHDTNNVVAPKDNVEDGSFKAPSGLGNPLSDLLNIFRPTGAKAHPTKPHKVPKALRRAQTLKAEDGPESPDRPKEADKRPGATRGDSLIEDSTGAPPPKTSVFTAAGDILNPPIPPMSWLLDPSTRDRTIFHDRIYHPEDIPPPPQQKRPFLTRSFSSSNSFRGKSNENKTPQEPVVDASGMKIEEKIARAYHRDLSWRKVLVRLEPDAHNNMVVRRMFANAYGWDVIKHLCDTHFSDNEASLTRDSDESNEEHAKPMDEPISEDGKQVNESHSHKDDDHRHRTFSETREERDEVGDLSTMSNDVGNLASASVRGSGPNRHHSLLSEDSVVWNDDMLDSGDNSDDDSEEEEEPFNPVQAFSRFWNGDKKEGAHGDANKHDKHHHAHRHHHDRPELRLHAPSTSQAEGSNASPAVADAITQSPVEFDPSKDEAPDAETLEPLKRPRLSPADGGSNPPHMASGVADLGLQKPPEAHLADSSAPSSPESFRFGSPRLTERVARLSSGSKEL